MRTNVSAFENGRHPSQAQLVLALDRELAADQLTPIVSHIEDCAACRAQWDRLQQLSEQITAYHHALEAGCAPALRPTIASPRRLRRIAGIAVAGAAAAVIACMAWLQARVQLPAPLPHLAEMHSPPLLPDTKLPPATTKVRPAARRKRPHLLAAEMSSFIALPFSDRALPLGEATVVRVELPIEELRLTGLAVDGARTGTLVQTDVLMGVDGLPRAIRLVQ